MRLLIIGQEKQFGLRLKMALEQQGYIADYRQAHPASSCLNYLKVNHELYHLFLLDGVSLSGDELTLCAAIRTAQIELPMLILSDQNQLEDMLKAFDLGADDYLVKPFRFPELVARIRALLRRPRQLQSDLIRVGSIMIDVPRRQAFLDGKSVDLTLKEFYLMEYFARNPNLVLSRDQILDYAWDFDFSSLSNVVDAHIKNLRKKLHAYDCREQLETIRGIGYRLRV